MTPRTPTFYDLVEGPPSVGTALLSFLDRLELMMSSLRTLITLSLPLLLVTGCPDAEGEYEAFVDRHEQIHPPGSGGAAGAAGAGGTDAGGDAAVCEAPKPKEIDGDYLFALAAVLDTAKPILFRTKVTTEDVGGKTGMRWKLQPLLWSDRKTEVGTIIDLPATTEPAFLLGADGTFDAKLPPLTITGEANPFSHTDLTAEVTLKGKFCGVADFFCGTADGGVTVPLEIPLKGSTWTLEKVTGTTYPEPPHINCKKKEALPVGTWQ